MNSLAWPCPGCCHPEPTGAQSSGQAHPAKCSTNTDRAICVLQPPGACPGSPFPREVPHEAPQTRSGSFHQRGGVQITRGAALPTPPCADLACRTWAPAARGASPKCPQGSLRHKVAVGFRITLSFFCSLLGKCFKVPFSVWSLLSGWVNALYGGGKGLIYCRTPRWLFCNHPKCFVGSGLTPCTITTEI